MNKTENKKIIAIGTSTQNNKWVNGQSMMFQLFVDEIIRLGYKPIMIDFGLSLLRSSNEKRISGHFSLIKAVDNIVVLIKFFTALILNPRSPIYLNTSQTKVGFVRDYIIINAAAMLGRKIIAHQFGANYTSYYSGQSDNNKKKIKTTLLKTHKIVVEGDYTKEQFSFLPGYQERVISIPNGLPEKVDFSGITPKMLGDAEEVELLYLSNMIESKGFWDVLEAFRILVQERDKKVNITFAGKFFGDTNDTKFQSPKQAKNAFLKYIEDHQLSSRVTYCPNGLYTQEKAAAFQKAHFFVLPSYYTNEGQPVAVVEALAYGCVCITTKHRLIPMMVTEDNGAFVNPKAPQEIADVIEKFIDSPTLYHQHSKKALSDFAQKFTAEKFVQQLLKVIESHENKR